MTAKHHYQAYAAATQTVSTTRQIVMLYDGTIRYLQQARQAIEEKRIEDRYNLLLKASEIIFGLQSYLNFERGGDIAQVLYNFYASVDTRIFTLQRNNSTELCEQIITDLKQMRDVWHEIDQKTVAGVPEEPAEPATTETPPAPLPGNYSLSA